MWLGPQQCYLVADDEQRPRFEKLAGKGAVRSSGQRRQDGDDESALP
jgi:hypothetical protein